MESKKIVIFSHESDIDGLGCVVLAKLAFENVEYFLAPNVEKLEKMFRKYICDINGEKAELPREIFVTDLALYEPSLSMVAQHPILKGKVHVFDHHKRAIEDKMDKYGFTTIIEEDQNGKKCGTLLFYQFLVESGLLKPNDALDRFVLLTTLEDTWEWKKDVINGIDAHDLAILFNAIGKEEYLKRIIEKLKKDTNFILSKEEMKIIADKKKEYEELIRQIASEIEVFEDEDGNTFGAVFANYEYRNEIAEYIKKNNQQNIAYLIIIAMDKGEFGQKSYRAIQPDFDVNIVAMKHGGGGHPGAASVNITEKQNIMSRDMPSVKTRLRYLSKSKFM